MAFQFPWTNFHELNLDWFLSKFKQFTNNFLQTTATAESVAYGTQPSVTVTGGTLDDDTDIVDPFNFHFKIPQGMGISSLTITYNVTNDDTQPISGWTTTKPAVNPGQYLWIRQTIILQNGIGQSYTYFVYYPVDGTTPTITIDNYPTENSPNAVSSGGVWSDLNDLKNLTSSNFAWMENSSTASRSYKSGDYVTINGVLCQITATVASGATLTENTNYKVISGNGGGFNNLGKITTNERYTIIGNICFVNMKYTVTANDVTNGYLDWSALLPPPVYISYYQRIVLFGSRENANYSAVTLLTIKPPVNQLRAIWTGEVASTFQQHTVSAGETYYVKGFYIV